MQGPQDEKIVLPVEMPKSLRARLKATAKDLDRSMAWCVRDAIELWLTPSSSVIVSRPPTTSINPHTDPGPSGGAFREVTPRFKKGKS